MKKIVAISFFIFCLNNKASQNDVISLKLALQRVENVETIQSLIQAAKFSQEDLNSCLEIARDVLNQGFERNDPEFKMKAALNAGCLIAVGATLRSDLWAGRINTQFIGENTKLLYETIVHVFYEQFLQKYKDPAISKFDNKTANMIKRICSSNPTIMEFYQDKLDDVFKFLLSGLLLNKPKIQQLINMGVDVNFKSAMKQSPLIYVLGHSPFPSDSIKFLLDNGAQVNTRDQNGKTVFWYASKKDASPEIFQLLFEALNKELMSFRI